MSPKARGFGSHTLKDAPDNSHLFRPSWANALDRWGPVPDGYALCECGCEVRKLNGEVAGRQQWVVRVLDPPPRPRWKDERFPLVPSWPREGDTCELCGQQIRQVVPREWRPVLEALAPLGVTGASVQIAPNHEMSGTVPDQPAVQRSLAAEPEFPMKSRTMWEEKARAAARRRLQQVE